MRSRTASQRICRRQLQTEKQAIMGKEIESLQRRLCSRIRAIKVTYPDNWEEWYGKWKEKDISSKEAMTILGLKKDSFYRLVKKWEENQGNDE